MSDATGPSSYVFDSFGELASATNGASQTVGYGYNADGAVNAITYPLPTSATWATTDTVSYTYDNANLLTGVTDFNGQQISITNNSDSLPASEVLGSTGDTISPTYDSTDSPSAISLKNSSSTLQSFSYSDAPDGNILTETDTPSSSHSPASYTYDGQGRLASMTSGSGSPTSYGFDASGNLNSLPTGATTQYDNAGELTSSTLSGVTTTYAYNADGEALNAKQGSSTLSSASWNGAGELTAYNNSTADMTAASYGGDGLRASATIGSTSQVFTWNTTVQVPELLQDSTNAYIYASSGTPTEQVNLSTGSITYLVADLLGSVRGIVSSNGSLAATTSYDAWGNPETVDGLTAYTPFEYAGAYTDTTGLLYLVDRYYNPGIGQFLSLDPKISQTLSPYAYANDNPVNSSDPTGDGAAWGPAGYFFMSLSWGFLHSYWATFGFILNARRYATFGEFELYWESGHWWDSGFIVAPVFTSWGTRVYRSHIQLPPGANGRWAWAEIIIFVEGYRLLWGWYPAPWVGYSAVVTSYIYR